MSALKPHQPRPTGPRVEGGPRGGYQVLGLPNYSEIYHTRAEAEKWLRTQLAKLPERQRPQLRACLTCGHGFESDGAHNRMCAPCRQRASQEDAAPFSFGAIHGRKRG